MIMIIKIIIIRNLDQVKDQKHNKKFIIRTIKIINKIKIKINIYYYSHIF
jgi:hypothetical protein